MSEWEEKLNTLLSDPDAMAQVMQMAQSLSQQMGQPGGAASTKRCSSSAAFAPAAGRTGERFFPAARRHRSLACSKAPAAALAAQSARERRNRRLSARAAAVFEAGTAGQG